MIREYTLSPEYPKVHMGELHLGTIEDNRRTVEKYTSGTTHYEADFYQGIVRTRIEIFLEPLLYCRDLGRHIQEDKHMLAEFLTRHHTTYIHEILHTMCINEVDELKDWGGNEDHMSLIAEAITSCVYYKSGVAASKWNRMCEKFKSMRTRATRRKVIALPAPPAPKGVARMKKPKPPIIQLQALRRGYLIRCTQCKKVVPNRLVCLWCGAWIGNDYYSSKEPIKKERKQMSPSTLVSAVEWFR